MQAQMKDPDIGLIKFSRKRLESYMIDCHGFDAEQCAEWLTKYDLAADIRSNGWAKDCAEYCS